MLIHYMDCQSNPPYRHGLSRYYQQQSPPNSYPLPSIFTSYSITLPVYQSSPNNNNERNIPYGPYQQSYYQPPPKFQPKPQYCPETGRTVCSKVSYYPSDEVFMVVKMARAKRFNISSEFVDESENDSEPYFEDDFDWKYFRNMMSPNGFSVIKNNPSFQRDIPIQNSMTRTTLETNNQIHGSLKSMYSSNGDQSFSNNHFNNHNNMGVHGHSRYKRQADETPISIEPLCPSRTILLEPKAALNDRRQWKYVVNLADRDRRLRQAIKVEVCMTPNAPCSNQISLPFGFVSKCRQKYIKKKLISLDESGQSISSENFFAPSCCVCEVSRGNPSIQPTSVSSPSGPNNLDTAASMSSSGSPVSIQTESSKKRLDEGSKQSSKQKQVKFDIDRPQSDAPIIIRKNNENRKTRNNHPNDGNKKLIEGIKV
ncbi:hypothetical protein BLA29_003379 [Euroglyphus maynei]|uniref:Spaetzle domain-containing protein n=1 Tax=Euroglyphus maynei TaxID=6958 RepID=A0A1Y3BMG7_EURMA|nr:hypothetical protein BLA29_003379 [Euroglyphus maynei]